MMNPKGIIFDMDGLLIDSEVISLGIYQSMLKPFEKTMTKALYAKEYSGITEIENVRHLIESFQLPYGEKEGLERSKALEEAALKDGVPLKKGAQQLLTYLAEHQYRMAIASSSRPARAHRILEQHHLDQRFDAFVFGEDVPRGKPSPDIFLEAARQLQLRPAECLVLEDSEMGIKAAHAGKIPVICVPDMKQPRPEYVDLTVAVCSSLDEVLLRLRNHD